MKKHNFDLFSFLAGAIFLMIATASVLNTDLHYELSGWVLPASVLVLGVGLLAASLRGMRNVEDNGPDSEEDHRPQTTDHGPELADDSLVDDPVGE
jgi:hypothetical protein